MPSYTVVRTTLVLVLLVAATLVAHAAAAVTAGCALNGDTSEANAFFTLTGSSKPAADGCYAIAFRDADAAGPSPTCTSACAIGGLLCEDENVPQGSSAGMCCGCGALCVCRAVR